MGIEARWGFRVGTMPHGPRNKISDVPGVTVGHCTLAQGEVQTGVTALLPHPGDTFHQKVAAASCVINGFGKTIGLVQIDELGTLETPILFTNTLSVGTAATALVRYMLERCPDICESTGSVNPVVCECNDSGLNDIRGLHVTEADALAALADCRADFAEGAVGAGRGMRCHGLKGGIGSSSRVVELDGQSFHLGALVLSNHARFDDLILAGVPIAQRLGHRLLLRQRQRRDRHRLFHGQQDPPLPPAEPAQPAGGGGNQDRPAVPGGGRVRGGERAFFPAPRRDCHRPGRPDRPQPGGPVAGSRALNL